MIIKDSVLEKMSALEVYHYTLLYDATRKSAIKVGKDYIEVGDHRNAELSFDIAAINLRELLRLKAYLAKGELNSTPDGLYLIFSSSKI